MRQRRCKPAYRTRLFIAEMKEHKRQEQQSTKLNKLFAGTLKPSDSEIIERLRLQGYDVI